ncbi:MAG TPA: DUF2905 domain-containing protein [Methyloceanibacter sp.]|nr:DUF2905 domain-containing protein [Methyloceanibacter sp.]
MKSAVGIVVFLGLVALFTFLSVRYGLGRLPGDIVIDRGNFYFYLPITTAIIVSLLLSLLFWLFNRFGG